MPSSQSNPPTFESIAPRFAVGHMKQALAFYEHLGFHTTYHDEGFADEGFAIVERDGVDLHFNAFDELPKSHSAYWIAVTNIDALY